MPLPRWITKSEFEVTPTPSLSKTRKGYRNWELSSERAQASRRVLARTGLFPDRISSVAGRASLDPLLPDDTKSPRNRRISILLLRRKVSEKAEAIKKTAIAKSRQAAKKTKPPPRSSQAGLDGAPYSLNGANDHPTCSLDVNIQRFMVVHYV